MAKVRFSINLSVLYSKMGTEYDETPEDLMSYEEFVEFVKDANIYVLKTEFDDYLVIENEYYGHLWGDME